MPGRQPIDKLFAACKVGQGGSQASCSRGMQSMVGGLARRGAHRPGRSCPHASLAPGRYYVIGFVPYQGHSLLWHLPVDVKAGANPMSLEPQNGSISH